MGRPQQTELSLLYEYTLKRVAVLTNSNNDQEFITTDEVNDFLDRFAHQRPDAALLKTLRGIVFRARGKANTQTSTDAKNSILDYCLDIAAACVANYPYPQHERIMNEEKKLLIELMQAFHISPQQPLALEPLD